LYAFACVLTRIGMPNENMPSRFVVRLLPACPTKWHVGRSSTNWASPLGRGSQVATFARWGDIRFGSRLAFGVRCDVIEMTLPGTCHGAANGTKKGRMLQLMLTIPAMTEYRRWCFHESHTSRPTSTFLATTGRSSGILALKRVGSPRLN